MHFHALGLADRSGCRRWISQRRLDDIGQRVQLGKKRVREHMANMSSFEISSRARSFGQLGLGDTLGETDDFSSEGRRERRPFVIF